MFFLEFGFRPRIIPRHVFRKQYGFRSRKPDVRPLGGGLFPGVIVMVEGIVGMRVTMGISPRMKVAVFVD